MHAPLLFHNGTSAVQLTYEGSCCFSSACIVQAVQVQQVQVHLEVQAQCKGLVFSLCLHCRELPGIAARPLPLDSPLLASLK